MISFTRSVKFSLFFLSLLIVISHRSQAAPSENESQTNAFIVEGVNTTPTSTSLSVVYSYSGQDNRAAVALIKPQFTNPVEVVFSAREISSLHLEQGTHEAMALLRKPCGNFSTCDASGGTVIFVNRSEYFAFKEKNKPFESLKYFFKTSFNHDFSWNMTSKMENPIDMDDELGIATAFLDSGGNKNLRQAKIMLEQIILEEPDNVQAYIEMARWNMKSNWGPSGLKNAEEILDVALSIDENYANTYILRGYVYTHQGRFKEARQDFQKAETIGSDNLWLEVNHGQMYVLQGQYDKGLALYNIAIDTKRPEPSRNDRPKKAAFDFSAGLLKRLKEYHKLDILLKKRTDQFVEEGCSYADHAHLKLYHLHESRAAINLARIALERRCSQRSYTNNTYSDALIIEWLKSIESGIPDNSLYNRAIIIDADWANKIYRLVKIQEFNSLLKLLISKKDIINSINSEDNCALSIAVLKDDATAVKDLLALGANPNLDMGHQNTPYLTSLLTGKRATIEAFLSSGVKLESASFPNGLSAEDLLRSRGMEDLATLAAGVI